jgi:hypothetical protein
MVSSGVDGLRLRVFQVIVSWKTLSLAWVNLWYIALVDPCTTLA